MNGLYSKVPRVGIFEGHRSTPKWDFGLMLAERYKTPPAGCFAAAHQFRFCRPVRRIALWSYIPLGESRGCCAPEDRQAPMGGALGRPPSAIAKREQALEHIEGEAGVDPAGFAGVVTDLEGGTS